MDGRLRSLAAAAERGEHELVTGDRAEAASLLLAMSRFSSGVGLIPEQGAARGGVHRHCGAHTRGGGTTVIVGLPAVGARLDLEKPGTGLGLALCQRIVQHHGGAIEVHSVEGRGATFVVRLPAVLRRALPPEAPAAGVAPASADDVTTLVEIPTGKGVA